MSDFEKKIFNEQGRFRIPDESGTLRPLSQEEWQKQQNENKEAKEDKNEENKEETKNYQPGDIIDEQGRKMVVGEDYVLRPATQEDLERAEQKKFAEEEKPSENQ